VQVLGSIVEPAARFLSFCCANLLLGSSIRSKPIRDDHLWTTVLSHRLLEKFQCCFLVPGLCHEAFQNLTLVVNRPLEVVPLAVELHENLVEMPPPIARPNPFDPAYSFLIGEHRPKPVPPKPHRLVADVDTTLVEQILDIPERQREPHIEHHCKADDLRASFEVLERGAFGHARTLAGALPCLKRSSFDKTYT
jgi:hypothetical protein